MPVNRWFDPVDRARRRQIADLPVVLHALARALRNGMTLHGAVQQVAADPVLGGAGLEALGRRIGDGSRVEHEIDRWAASLGHRDADLVRAVVLTGANTGSALAAAFERAAASLEERAETAREIAALTVQARASALLLTVAPFGFLSVVGLVDASVIADAFGSARGRLAFGCGVVLDLAGWFWMRHLMSAVDR